MKYLVASFLVVFCSLTFAAKKYTTDRDGVYIKNFKCESSSISGNLVNKSSLRVWNLYINIFDSDGDPIDKILIPNAGADPNSGNSFYKAYATDCSNLYSIKFTTK